MSPRTKTPVRHDSPVHGRFYEIDGQLLPSVTHILGCIGKPALINWAASEERKLVTEAAAQLYTDWAAELVPPVMPREAYVATLTARLGTVKAHQKLLTKAGDLGTQIHQHVEWFMRTAIGAEAGPEPVVVDAARWASMAFEDWAKSVALKPVLIEKTVYSLAHGFAGTLDLLARVDGVLTVVDFKSGKAIYPEASLQNAAYQTAMREMGYAPAAGLIVRLPKLESDPAFEVAPVPAAADLFPVFLAVKELWRWTYANDEAYRLRQKAVA
jgi:hypothetical protein